MDVDRSPTHEDYEADDGMQVDDERRHRGEAASGDGVRRKGRGFQSRDEAPRDGIRSDAQFDKAESDERSTGRAQRSIEGWIIVITGVHEEATEEELSERFADYGVVQNLHLNLDRRTGYVKGYALVEYETYKEAKAAIDAEDGQEMLGETIRCDFAFVRPAQNERDNRGRRHGGDRRRRGGRSISPQRRD